jgi:hypothetical protein
MYEKKKKEESAATVTSSESQSREPLKKDLISNKVEMSTGNYILRLDGLVSQIHKELEKVPAGDIPVKVLHEAADIHTFGRQTYLFFMEKSKNLGEKILLVDAVGLEELSRKVTEVYGKYRLIDVVSQPVNKRPQSKKIYLAIFVG